MQEEHGFYPQAGSTVIGGPSGDDGDSGFVSPYSASIRTNTQVNEWNKDDHSIHLEHKDVYPRSMVMPVAFGSPAAKGPRVPRMDPLEKHGAPGGTVMGGPSGNDGDERFGSTATIDIYTDVNEHNEDDRSITLDHEDSHSSPPSLGSGPFRRSENLGAPPFAAPPAEHFEPHSELHEEPHPESHYQIHPEPHFVNHPEPHYDSHYSPSYETHYEPHTELNNELTAIKNLNNGPAAGAISFGRHGLPARPESHFVNHPEPHH